MLPCYSVYFSTMHSDAVRCTVSLVEYHSGNFNYYSGVWSCVYSAVGLCCCALQFGLAVAILVRTLAIPLCETHFSSVSCNHNAKALSFN